jgi:hypothetical protein
MGPFAHMSEVRRDPLLRQLAGATREQARTWERAPGNCIGGGRRALAVLLSGRRLRRILVEHLQTALTHNARFLNVLVPIAQPHTRARPTADFS